MDIANENIRYLGDVQKPTLGPDDTLVLSCDECLSDAMVLRLKAELAEIFPGRKSVVLSRGLKLGVLEELPQLTLAETMAELERNVA